MEDYILKRRQMSNLIHIWDDIVENTKEDYSGISQQTVDFFLHGSELIFPAKSIFVAIVYAKCMETYFGVDFYSALDDNQLLINDKYFTVYSQNKQLYDEVIEQIGKDDILDYRSTQKTVEYFKKEFLI